MRLLLVSMPWAIFNRPSIQLGTLKAYLQAYLGQQSDQTTVGCCHHYLDVMTAIGMDTYRMISESPWAAESLYNGLLFPQQQAKAAQVFRQALKSKTDAEYFDLLPKLEQQLQNQLDRQDLTNCSLIGFSICFSQLGASLYAAQAYKKRWPDIPIVLGGSSCTPSLGKSLVNIFPEIDFVITGEGEQLLCELLLYLDDPEKTPLTNPNIISRQSTNAPPLFPNQEIADLAQLPLPDYDDYFLQMKATGLDFIPELPLEFSRGCWWNKCTFCNLNLQWQGYRFKKSGQVVNEVDQMKQKYQSIDFTFTDNALPIKEADLFFETMAERGHDLRFFGEIRTLKKPETYSKYRKGGLNSVQIGIEALSDSLLSRMCKGTTVLDNLAAMKFAQAAKMILDGNLILEFPGSTQQEVDETLRILDQALPFRPLTGAGFFLGHGSPVCNQPQKYGIKAIVQHPTNRQLYPPEILNNLDMLIKSYRGDRTIQSKQWQPVRDKIKQWRSFHKKRVNPAIPALSYRDGGTFLIIRQELPDSRPLHHRLRGLSRQIYLACEQPISKKKLLSRFSQVTKEQLSSFMADLEQKNIMYCNASSCLALAIRQS